MWSRSKFVRALTGGIVTGAALVTAGASVAAQTSASQTCVIQEINQHFFINGPSQSAVFSIAIPAGTVSIPTATARDFYEGRSEVTNQVSEKWQLQFLDTDGNVIATSAATVDVPDGEDDQSWTGSLPDVGLPRPAVGVRAVHRPDLPSTGAAMSVWATGVTLCWPAVGSSVVCPPDAAGNPVTPNPDGSCSAPAPAGPTPSPSTTCSTNPAGNPVTPNPDGSCPSPAPTPTPATPTPATPTPATPTPATPCGTDAAGGAVAPNADGTCPIPAPAGPTLPVTGLQSTLLVALAGLFAVAAGFSLVLRPGTVKGLD